MTYRLSPNFTLEEMVKSQTAERKGIPNAPELHHIDAMELLCEKILQPIRDKFGSFMVSSGYRSPELCVAIGSKITSQHAKGEAADFEVAGIDNYDLARWIEEMKADILHVRSRMPAWIVWKALNKIPEQKRPKMVSTIHGLYSVNFYSAVMSKPENIITVSNSAFS